MSPLRRIALVAGGFYLLTFLTSIPALALHGPMLDDPDFILGAGSDTRVVWGGLLDMICAVAGIGTAVTLFPLLRRQNEAFALGFVTTRVLEAAIMFVGAASLMSVVSLRDDLAVAGAPST